MPIEPLNKLLNAILVLDEKRLGSIQLLYDPCVDELGEVILGFCLLWSGVAQRLGRTLRSPLPVNPPEGSELDLTHRRPRTLCVNDLCLAKTIDCSSQRISTHHRPVWQHRHSCRLKTSITNAV